jgi:hypothetical protein
MPTGLSIALRFLYVFLFLCFVGLSLVQPTAQWLDAKLGAWAMWGCIAAYFGIIAATVGLINKINRDWPPYSLPPPARSGRGRQVEMMPPGDTGQSEPSEKPYSVRLPAESRKPTEMKTWYFSDQPSRQ